MATLKVRCPECDASLRFIIETIDVPTNIALTCPECEHEFETLAEPTLKPTMKARRVSVEQEDERPQRSLARKSNSAPIVVGVIAGVLLIGGGILAAVMLGTSTGKESESAKADTHQQDPKPAKTDPQPNGSSASAKLTSSRAEANPGEAFRHLESNSSHEKDAPAENSPEDVFARAAAFKPTAPLPELPALPPIERRPILSLDAGGHTSYVREVFLTPDNRRAITVGDDKSIRIWNVLSGDTVANVRLPAHPGLEGTPRGAALSPDGKLLAVGMFPLFRGRNGNPIYVLSTETGELARVIENLKQIPWSLHFSPDGKQLAIGFRTGLIQVIDFETGKPVYEVTGHSDSVIEIRFHPERPLIASIGRNKEVKVWSLEDAAKPVATIRLINQKPNTLDWSSDGKKFAVGTVSGEVYLYDPTGKPIKTVPAMMEGPGPIQITSLRFLPGDKQVVFGGIAMNGWAGVIDLETGKRSSLVKDHTNTVMRVNRSRDGTLAVSSGGDENETIVWKVSNGSIVNKFAAPSKGLWAVGWGKDGKSLAWGSINNKLADGLCPLEKTFWLSDFVTTGMLDPTAFQRHVWNDGTFAIQVNSFFKFTVFEKGRPSYQYTSGDGDRIYSVTILPGKGIVVGGSFAMVLLDLKTGKIIRDYRIGSGFTAALAPSPDGKYFVSASSDEIVRVWVPDQSEPLLSIFNVGHEWIAWTPQGYYSCSPYGERLIGWQVNNGASQLPTVHPAVRFRPSLYQPELIKYLIPAGNLQVALAMAATFDKQTVTVSGLAEVLPPSVKISAPLTADDAVTTVKAVTEGNEKNPIIAMRLLVDGRPFQGATGVRRFAPAQPKAEASWQVTLSPGPHTLNVQAESAVSKGMSMSWPVSRIGKEQIPKLYVLAVGVSEYPGDMKLNYAASDAELIGKTFKEKSKSLFSAVDVRTLTDKNANRQSILEGLDWLRSKMTPNDVGVFFFSGHGMRDRQGRFFLVPVDVNLDDPTGSCVSGEEFKTSLANMPGRLLAILDACHSGAAAGTAPGKQAQLPSARPDNLVRDLVTDDYGVVVMCSSLGREYSMESSTTKAGFFTLGLTEGLSGLADFNKDGFVFIHELDTYSTMRVRELSHGRQNPTFGRPPTVRPFPLSTVDTKP